MRAVEKLTERNHGELRFRSVPPLLVPLHELVDPNDARRDIDIVSVALEQYAESLDADRRYLFATYRFVDMAQRSSGSGASAHAHGCSCSSGAGGGIPSCFR